MSDPLNEFQKPEPTRQKGMRPWMWLLCLGAAALFFGSCGLGAGLIAGKASSAAGSGDHRETLVDGEADADKKIAVIPIEGVIMESMGAGPGSVSELVSTLKSLEEDDQVVGVLLAIDTPGGGVTASDRMYHELMEFKKRTKLPVHALFLDVAASGGYYVAMAADHITAHPTTITGSIGVISKFYNVSEAMGKIGVSVNVIKSLNSQGKTSFKDIGSPYRPMSPEERKLIQGLITEMWDRFTDIVSTGRAGKMKPEKVKALADGRVFTGEQALAEGLVDAVGYREDAYAKIREAAKSPDAKLVSYRKQEGLKELLGFSAQSSKAEDLSVLTQAARAILAEQAGFLYLWTAGSFSAP